MHSEEAADHATTGDDFVDESKYHDLLKSIAGVAGNILEWYDFALFGYFSDIIGDNFFPPNQEGDSSLIESFAVFGLAFLARPLGGAIFGKFGDLHGNKTALETSVFFMALATFLMGCLPTYSMVGWISPVLLILTRLFQGLSVGGQVMSSVLFTIHQKDISKWGFLGSTVFAAINTGVVIGSAVASIVRGTLTEEQLVLWGWRIPFLFGIVGGIPALYLKLRVKQATNSSNESRDPLRKVLNESNRRALFAAALIPTTNATVSYLLFTWLVIFMDAIIEPPIPNAFPINTINTILGGVLLSLFGGWLADQIGSYVKQMVVSGILLAVSSPILFGLMGMGGEYAGLVAFSIQLFLSLLLAIWLGAMVPFLVLITAPEYRLTSLSLGYNFALAIWGGFSPLVATILADQISFSAPGYLISVAVGVGLLGILIAPRNHLRGNNSHHIHDNDDNDDNDNYRTQPLL